MTELFQLSRTTSLLRESFIVNKCRITSATVFNYVGFRVVLALSPLLSEESAKDVARLRFRRRFESHGEAASRQRVCLHLAEDAMPLVVLHVYAVVFNKLYAPSIEKVQ